MSSEHPDDIQQPEPPAEPDNALQRGLKRLGGALNRSQGGSSEVSNQLAIVLILLAVVAGVTIGLLIMSRSDDKISGVRMTLELSYPRQGEASARLTGQPGAAPEGSRITCRATSDDQEIGSGRADRSGAFDVELDAARWPVEELNPAEYQLLNTTVECRADGGAWQQPLRPTRVAIN